MGHGGVLNFGDVFSYALAQARQAPPAVYRRRLRQYRREGGPRPPPDLISFEVRVENPHHRVLSDDVEKIGFTYSGFALTCYGLELERRL
jgi:hypothetical protein